MSSFEEFEHLRIPLQAIELATNNFSKENYISEGGFGKVYKGELVHLGQQSRVAVKRLDANSSGQGTPEFWKEVMMLSRYQHPNLVSLLGFCREGVENILVYEYLSNKSLDMYIDSTTLSWIQRLNICIGAARGLEYLHNPGGTTQRVLHRDIKSSNILLDENWSAKISDFGFSKFGPANQEFTFLISHVAGTPGYCDPLYLEKGLLTKESDIYSFGVVLFEVLSGRFCFKNYNDGHPFLTLLAKSCYDKRQIGTIVHSCLKDQISEDCLGKFSTIAYQCLREDRFERPSIAEILEQLVIVLDDQVEYDIEKEKKSKSHSEVEEYVQPLFKAYDDSKDSKKPDLLVAIKGSNGDNIRVRIKSSASTKRKSSTVATVAPATNHRWGYSRHRRVKNRKMETIEMKIGLQTYKARVFFVFVASIVGWLWSRIEEWIDLSEWWRMNNYVQMAEKINKYV